LRSQGLLDEDAATADQRKALGDILWLAEPVSEAVLSAAVEDETYATNLLLCRRDRELLEHLLANPPRQPRRFGRAELAARAAGALVRWGKTGFAFVDDDVLRRRHAACSACPELTEREGTRTCGLCGCRIEWKVRLTSESCPAPHDRLPGLTRWSEPTATTMPREAT
jgi:hypothetical protein